MLTLALKLLRLPQLGQNLLPVLFLLPNHLFDEPDGISRLDAVLWHFGACVLRTQPVFPKLRFLTIGFELVPLLHFVLPCVGKLLVGFPVVFPHFLSLIRELVLQNIQPVQLFVLAAFDKILLHVRVHVQQVGEAMFHTA